MLRFAPPPPRATALRAAAGVRVPRGPRVVVRDVRCGAPPRAEYDGLANAMWGLLLAEPLDAKAASRAKGLAYPSRSDQDGHGLRVVLCTPHFWAEVWQAADSERGAAIRSTVCDSAVVFAYRPATRQLRVVERHDWPDYLVVRLMDVIT